MIGLGRVQQQQRVAGRRRIDDDELVLALRDGVGEGAKDRNLLRARRAQVFLEQRAPLRVEPLAGRGEHLLGVASRLGSRIDTRDVQRRGPFPAAASTCAAGSVVVSITWCPPGELGGNAHGERRLADAPFAHRHHHALAARRDLLDKLISVSPCSADRGGFDTCGR